MRKRFMDMFVCMCLFVYDDDCLRITRLAQGKRRISFQARGESRLVVVKFFNTLSKTADAE